MLKGHVFIFTPKSSFTHSQIVTNMYKFLCSTEHKEKYLGEYQ